MDKGIAQARQVQAQEATAAGVAEIKARLDTIEAKLDALLASNKPEAEKPSHPKKAGA